MKRIFTFLLMIIGISTHAQNIRVYNSFSDFEPLLYQENDTTYVMNFWATWCIPCIKEMPYFQQLHDNFKNEKVKVILVSLDMSEEMHATVIPFVNKKGLTPQVVILDDPAQNAWIGKVSQDWEGSLPGTLFYKNSKRVFYEKSFNYEELSTVLNTFLN